MPLRAHNHLLVGGVLLIGLLGAFLATPAGGAAPEEVSSPALVGDPVEPASSALVRSLSTPTAATPPAETETPPTNTTWDGIGVADGCGACWPPSPSGDVGPNHYVQMVHFHEFAVWDKDTGTLLAGPLDFGDLWPSGDCKEETGSNPNVLYDPIADRWVLAAGAGGTSDVCIAVSQDPDPTGAYWLYEFDVGAFPGYLALAVWTDAYYMSASEATYTAYALDRSAMLVGNPATFQKFTGEANMLMPADLDGSSLPPAEEPGIFYTFKDDAFHGGVDRIEVFELDVDWDTPGNSTFGLADTLFPTGFEYTVCGFSDCIPQKDTAKLLDTVSALPSRRFPYRNFGSHQSAVGAFTVDLDGSNNAAIRWFEIRKSGAGAWALHQEGTVGDTNLHRWMGSIAMDGQGGIGLAYSTSSSTTFPSLRHATRRASDTLGTMRAESIFHTGTGSQTGSNRWGDYFSLSIDPVDDCTFWFTGEYYPTTSSWGWATRIGSFGGAPDNDDFVSAQALSDPLGGSLSSDNECASDETGEPAHDGTGRRSVWYSFTAPADGTFSIDTIGSSFDTVVAIYTGSPVDGLTLVAADDDGGGGGASALADVAVQEGTVYRVAVAGDGGAEGAFDLEWSLSALCDGKPVTIAGTAGPDVIHGTAGPDVIHTFAGADTIDGGGGNDVICAGDGDDVVNGGAGKDLIFGEDGDDTIDGQNGADELRGGRGDDIIDGGAGPDILLGHRGADTLNGGKHADTLRGHNFSDTLDGGNGHDYLDGGGGHDTLEGGISHDILEGKAGNDTLYGQGGDDILYGQGGDDDLVGGRGDDLLDGGTGTDTATGGPGTDTCTATETILSCEL